MIYHFKTLGGYTKLYKIILGGGGILGICNVFYIMFCPNAFILGTGGKLGVGIYIPG